MAPRIKGRGMRGMSIPSGFLLGRADKGRGDAQLLKGADLRRMLPGLGIPSSGGGGGGGGAVGANPTATAVDTAVNGSALTFMRSDAAPAVRVATNSLYGILKPDNVTVTITTGVISVVTATGAVKGIVRPDNTTITISGGVISAVVPAAANPSATASDTAVNGVASTFMRSDAAPAVQKATNAVFGVVKGDGSSVSIAAGVATVIPAGVGSVSAWYCQSAANATGVVNSTAVNTKGNVLSLVKSFTLEKVLIGLGTGHTGQTILLSVLEISAPSSSTVLAVLGTATAVAPATASMIEFTFATPLVLAANTIYGITVSVPANPTGTSTNLYALAAPINYPNLPKNEVTTANGYYLTLGSVTPTVGQIFSTTLNSGKFLIYIKGISG